MRFLVVWDPLRSPEEGYSIIIGVPFQLWDLVEIPLRSIHRADRTSCHEVILCIDGTEAELLDRFGPDLRKTIQDTFPDIAIRILCYNKWQSFVTRIIRWNWVDCWLTWSIGIGHARSRWILLHDFDAIIADPGFMNRHYQIGLVGGHHFVGIQTEPAPVDDGIRVLLMTIELLIDAQHLRATYRPHHMFNRVRKSGGLRIECDILRDIQLREVSEKCFLHVVREEQVIHPSQLVSQWTQLCTSKVAYRPRGYTPLLAIPYFRHLSGMSESLQTITNALQRKEPHVSIEGGVLDLSALDDAGLDWIAKQIDRMDAYFSVLPNEEARAYTRAIRDYRDRGDFSSVEFSVDRSNLP